MSLDRYVECPTGDGRTVTRDITEASAINFGEGRPLTLKENPLSDAPFSVEWAGGIVAAFPYGTVFVPADKITYVYWAIGDERPGQITTIEQREKEGQGAQG